jgi:hypothetical protein
MAKSARGAHKAETGRVVPDAPDAPDKLPGLLPSRPTPIQLFLGI